MRKMQFTNYWQQFEHTGRVEDYLKYLQSAEKEKPLAGAECKSPLMDHAGIPVCNRNCIKTDTFR